MTSRGNYDSQGLLVRRICLLLLLLLSGASLCFFFGSKTKSEPLSSTFFVRRNRQASEFLEADPLLDNSSAYRLLSSQEIHDTLLQWAVDYQDLARVTTAQQAYGLPRAGGPNDCPFDQGGDGCLNYILTIQDYTVHPEGSNSSNLLATVLLSGTLHGNERVGPTATMEAASLLLQAAACEATLDASCREDLEATFGMTARQRQWLARLVATRRILMVPAANALGYAQNVRTEGGVDVNRDFPFDVLDPKACMRTIGARALNEIFREQLIQLSLTFHAGTEFIGYQWGCPSYFGFLSPDDAAQDQIAAAYSLYGGSWPNTGEYIYGDMNSLIYFVRGGMEDFAYGSVDDSLIINCDPDTHGGYPASQTTYNDGTLRAFNMLVETSNKKAPPQSDLGGSMDVLNKDAADNGHVARNVRLSLLAVDIVEPYVSIVGVNDLDISDDVVPLASRGTSDECQNAKRITVPSDVNEVVVKWTVGGALTIDQTSIYYGKWSDVSANFVNCLTQPVGDVAAVLSQGMQNEARGTGYFSQGGPTPSGGNVLGPLFEAILDLSQYQVGDEIIVLARAQVDSAWTEQPDNIAPDLPPQSHIVNIRTDPSWYYESAGKVVEGRLDWYTNIPLTLVIGEVGGVLQEDSDRFQEQETPSRTTCQSGKQACSSYLECCSSICLASGQCLPMSRAGRKRGNGGSGGAGGGAGRESGFGS